MRKFTAIVLTLLLVLSLGTSALANQSEPQLIYSSNANSGTRDEVCIDLSGTSAHTYYTEDYTYDNLSLLSGDALLQTLRSLMTSTHSYQSTYDQCRDYSVITDCENADGTTINLLYTSYVVTMADYINNATNGGGWNREHVWPKSLGGFNTSGAGSDLHHIRPTDKSVNGKRGNEKYGIPTNPSPVTGTVTVENMVGGYSNNTYFEPLDNVKGDVARICLYVYVRYGGELSKCNSITNVFQSIDVLLQWHQQDPVDTWEMGRNEVVYAIQGNRNVFIDYPELAWLMFDREIPEGIMTPSYTKVPTCEHPGTTLSGVTAPTCEAAGYTGDTICTSCNIRLSKGQEIPATGHQNTEIRYAVPATCVSIGSSGDTYCIDCGQLLQQGKIIRPTGEHRMTDYQVSNEEVSVRYCLDCDYEEREYHEDPAQNSSVGIILIICGAVAAGAVAFVVMKKKKA